VEERQRSQAVNLGFEAVAPTSQAADKVRNGLPLDSDVMLQDGHS
jgi:hypothetical protein